MSNNHQPYRRHPAPAPTEHTRPSYSSSDNNQHFYRQHLEPSSALPSQSSSSYASSLLPGSDGALNILRSCGLEPTDLSLLAELPEDALTLDSLPHLLKQIKVRRGGGQTFPTPPAPPSSSSSHPPRSSSRQVTTSSASSGDWDKLRTQPIQYPLDHVRPTVNKSRPLPPEQVQDWQDRWGNPRQTGSVTHKTSSSSSASSSGYVVDYAHKDRAAVGLYDRVSPSSTASAPGESTIKPPSLFSLHVEEYRPKALPQPHEHNAPYSRMPPATAPLSSQPGVVDYRKPAPPPNEYRSLQPQQVSPYVGQPSSSQKQPSRKAALDFHGTTPVTYPYTCSLCDITVLSEKFWNQHVNAPQHADGQLAVLKQFPDWDCRLDNNRSSEPQRSKDEDRPAQRVHPNKKTQQKRPATGKVISAKFVAQSVDETYLRSLVETFGKVVKVILFPSLAFVEMGSSSQARDLVKWYDRNPVSSGQNIIFDHSSTFNFLQSSRVVSFSPAPSEEDNISDLISIIKRFGPLLYTLFLPSMAFVEMKFAPDAQKLVDYYSTNILKINDVAIKVFYSGEYNTLMRVPKAKKFEEEEEISGRKKSRSPRSAGRTRSRSPRSAGRTRSRSPPSKRRRSRDKEDREKRTDRERVSSERKREEEKREADKDRNREVEKKRDGEKEGEGEKESSERRARSESEELSSAPIKTDTHPETKPAADRPTLSEPSQPETKLNAVHQEDEVSEEDSDIEGMEVIGEDGDFVDDTDEEEEEENGEGQTTVKEEVPVEQSIATSTEPVEVSEAQSDQQEVPETAPVPVGDMEAESEPDFPIDLSNCITLDELGEETEEEEKCKEKAEEQCTKVLYFKNLPFKFYTDNDFLSIVKGYGKVSRYFLIRNRREGFIEMYSASDAIRAAEVLTSKTLEFNGSVLLVDLSHKYKTLTAGWKVESDSDEEKRDTDRSRSSRRLASKRKRTEREEENRREETGEREESTKETEKEKITDEGKEDKIKETEEENKEKGESKEEIKEMGEEENREGIKKTGEEGNREEIKETGQEGNREEMVEEENRIETGEEGKTKETGEEEKTKETGEEEKTKETGEEDKTMETGEEEKREEILKETGESMQEEKPATSEEVASSEPGSECPRASNKENPEVIAEVKDQAPAEPVQPTKPVGTEFVRPVVGYFCNLCQVIYADEEEAKSKHCSTLQHYNKYQEHTGRDPWTS